MLKLGAFESLMLTPKLEAMHLFECTSKCVQMLLNQLWPHAQVANKDIVKQKTVVVLYFRYDP